jgi:hypothetical protein
VADLAPLCDLGHANATFMLAPVGGKVTVDSRSTDHGPHDGGTIDVSIVEVSGGERFYVVCEAGRRLILINGAGLVAVREGYEGVADAMLRATGIVR